MSHTIYFAYGSNLDAEQMRERCPGCRPLFRARLHDHRLDFTHFSKRWGGGAADLIHEPGELVWGVTYALIDDHVQLLDGFEAGYDRVHLDVNDDHDVRHRVLTYTVRTKQRHEPSAVYIEKMLRWSQHWEFPEDYVSQVRSRSASPVEDPSRVTTREQQRPR